ncbi:MAG: hypothetical protein ABIF77_16455 [bacterium]
MLNSRIWSGVLLVVCLGFFAGPALGLTILVTPASNPDIDITPRLIGLGHTVHEIDPATWDAQFDYSVYDVVAFQHAFSDPADIAHLVDAVDAETVGVVFFRVNVEAAATALGLISSSSSDFQDGHQLSIVDNSHPITHDLAITIYDLGYVNMSYVANPAGGTTVLANGPDGAALVVHNSRRVVATPFYGHFAGHDNETAVGLGITSKSLDWAASEQVPVMQTTWGMVKALYAD